MFKFLIWLAICTAISPVLAIAYVIGEIAWVVHLILKDDRDRRRVRSLT